MKLNKQDAQPRAVIALWKANLQEPKLHQSDPSVTIVDHTTSIPSYFALFPFLYGCQTQDLVKLMENSKPESKLLLKFTCFKNSSRKYILVSSIFKYN